MENEGPRRKKRDKTTEQRNYVDNIKKILKDAVIKYGKGYRQLQKDIEDTYNFRINAGTLQKLFEDESSIDYFCLVTVCKFFGIDFNELLSPVPLPGKTERYTDIAHIINIKKPSGEEDALENEDEVFWNSSPFSHEKFPILDDDGYIGDFTGYIVPPTGKSTVRRFDLSLKKNANGVMQATMVMHYNPDTQSLAARKFTYRGLPLYAEAYRVVIMFLTDEDRKGEFFFFAMGFQSYRSDSGLIFRQGLSVTGEALGKSSIIAQNFVIFRHPLNQDAIKKYISGLLKAPNNSFCIQVSEAEELAEKYPEVKKFLNEASTVVKRRTHDMILFREDDILTLELPRLKEFDRIKALLILKGHSTVESKYYYKANNRYSDFAMKCMVDNDEEFDNGDIRLDE